MSEQDWVDDDDMPRDETLARFNALEPVVITGPWAEYATADGKVHVSMPASAVVEAPRLGGTPMHRLI